MRAKMEAIIAILIIVAIVRSIFSPKARQARDEEEQSYYKDLYRIHYGKVPNRRITGLEMAELEDLEDEDYEEE